MEKHINSEVLIVAVLQGEDYSEAIEELNGKGFYVTILNSTGGFLRKKSVTVMIGVKSKDLDEAIEVLKHYGKRIEMEYHTRHHFPQGESQLLHYHVFRQSNCPSEWEEWYTSSLT